MARRVIHELVDDLDGGTADESMMFMFDGINYEIDLSSKNATRLREVLAPFIAAGSKVGRAASGGGRVVRTVGHPPAQRTGGTPARTDRDQNRAIREWAERVGINVSDRGRIKQDVIDRFNAEAGRGTPSPNGNGARSATKTDTPPVQRGGRRRA